MVEDIDPHIIGITESWANIDITDAELGLTGYVMFRKDRIGRRGGGVILYVKESIQAYEIKLEREADCDEAVWCKIVSGNSKLTIGLVYRSPNINEEDNTKIKNAIKEVSKGECIIMGDFNHGHIQWNSLESTGFEDQQFLFLIQDSFLTQHVLEPTRGENVLDIVLSSQKELVDNVKIFEPLGNSDHNQIHFDINVKSESKNKKTYKRNFHKGNYKDMRKYLAKLDWNNMLMNKTAIECWNILKYEIESIIDKFVPFQKQGKRCRKKHLSKEAIRKIMLKQTMWRVYRRTRKDEDYAKYKEALNAATTEIRQSKRSYEQKLACNIKNDSKSFYAYVRSKQNVQDKVGPLEDNAGNIISQGFLMAEDLNGYFSSVFTKEDISSLPVADAKFQGAKSDYLGPLVVTPELVAKKIKAMKDNKSPGVDGIPPKLLMETVEQKAFDKVPHQRLLLKLKAHGIGDSITDWIEQWLTDRRQRVVVDGEVSNWKSVLSGVPQGSVLGPILFLIYINDLDDSITSNVLKFADDTKLFRKVNTDGDKQHLQNDLDRLVKWSEKWQMLFNFGKCKCLHTGHRNLNVNYRMGDTVLGTTVKEKDLGVTISADMKVSEQCGIAASKGNQILGLIRRNITYKGKKLIIPLYKAIVRPHLEYCIQAWRPYRKKDIDTLERIQRRATKMIPELRDLSYEERLKECGLTTLKTRRLRGDQIEVFKILNGYENIDRNMFFSLKKDSRTRGHEVKLVKDQCRLDIRKHSFSQRTINEWNKLSTDCVTASSVNMFKNKVDTYLRRAGYK